MLWAGGCCNAKPLMVRWDGDRYGAKEDWEDEQRRLGLGRLGLINVINPPVIRQDSWTMYHQSRSADFGNKIPDLQPAIFSVKTWMSLVMRGFCCVSTKTDPTGVHRQAVQRSSDLDEFVEKLNLGLLGQFVVIFENPKIILS